MPQFNIESRGFKEFKAAIKRNPKVVSDEVKKFLVRGIAEYNRGILRNPWRLGGRGGGAPYKTGHLRDTHRREIANWEARVYPTAPYALEVHEGTGRMKGRPWMDYIFQTKEAEVRKLENDLIKNIVSQLAK